MDDLKFYLRTSIPEADERQIQLLEYGLDDAFSYHEQMSGAIVPTDSNNEEVSFVEFWRNVEKIEKALFKLSTDKGTADAAHKTISKALAGIPLDYWDVISQYALPDDIDVLQALRDKPNKEQSNILYNVFVLFSSDKKEPGSGKARKQARKHLMAIQKLAQWFTETLGREPSANVNSTFYQYVLIYIEHIVKDDSLFSVERHIRNALNFKWT